MRPSVRVLEMLQMQRKVEMEMLKEMGLKMLQMPLKMVDNSGRERTPLGFLPVQVVRRSQPRQLGPQQRERIARC